MNILTIPDLHGKTCWKHVEVNAYDKVVFLGDYVDSKGEYSGEEEIENMAQIIDLKKRLAEKVILLLGNHDLHYLHYPRFRASSFNPSSQPALSLLFKENEKLFQYAFQIANHVWTHAGISQSWYEEHKERFDELAVSDPLKDLAGQLNEMQTLYLDELAEVGYLRGGTSEHGGILWADQSETIRDYLPSYHQYVGHSKVRTMTFIGDQTSSIYYLDCLNSEEKYLTQSI